MRGSIPPNAIVPIAAAVAILLVLGVFGEGLVGVANIFVPGELISVNGVQGELVKPLFGYYECGPLAERIWNPAEDAIFNPDSSTYIKPQSDYVQSWDLGIDCWGGNFVLYQTDDPGHPDCKVANPQNTWCESGVATTGKTNIGTFGGQYSVRIGRCTGYAYVGNYQGLASMKYTPFGLVKYSPSGGKAVVDAGGCTMSKADNIVTDCKTMEGKGDGSIRCGDQDEISVNDIYKPLGFYETYNYVDVIVDVSALGNVKDYGGTPVMCKPAGDKYDLYSIGEVIAVDGWGSQHRYFMMKDRIATVGCCMGEDVLPGFYCDDWVLKQVPPGTEPPSSSCYGDWGCSNGGDPYTNPQNVNQWLREACVDGRCQVVASGTKECSSANACGPGYICNPTTFQCEQSTVTVNCGDGICARPYETWETCPADCSQPVDWLSRLQNSLGSLPVFMVMSALAIIVLALAAMVLPVPFLKAFVLKKVIMNWRMLILAWLVLTLMLWVVGGVQVASFYQASIAPVFGG